MCCRYHLLQLVFYLHAQYRLFRKWPTRSEIGISISSIDSNRSLYQYKLSYIHTCKHQLPNSFSTSLIAWMFLVMYYPLFCLWHEMYHLPYISWLYKLTLITLGQWKNSTCFWTKRASIITEPCIFKNILHGNIPVLFIILGIFKNNFIIPIHDDYCTQCHCFNYGPYYQLAVTITKLKLFQSWKDWRQIMHIICLIELNI